MEWIKGAITLIKESVKTRFILFTLGIILLFLKRFSKELSMTYFYNHFTWVVVLATFFFAATLIADTLAFIYSKIMSWVRTKKFDNYVMNLSGRKLVLVKTIYEGKGHAARMRMNDTELRELVVRNVIVPATTNFAVFPNEENLSNPPVYFLLQPRTLELIEKHYEYFVKKR